MGEAMNTKNDQKRSKIRALVIGATGYTGQSVVDVLGARGVETWAHVRPDSPSLGEWESRSEKSDNLSVCSAKWTKDAIRKAVREIRPTHVFLLLGTTQARAKRGSDSAVAETYESVDYGLTHMVIEAVNTAGLGSRVVYLSSIGVKDGTSNAYLNARARIEAELAKTDLSWVAVRASFISGSDRDESRPMERVAAVASEPFLKLAGVFGAKDFRERFRARSGRGVAELLVRFALDSDAQGAVHFDDATLAKGG